MNPAWKQITKLLRYFSIRLTANWRMTDATLEFENVLWTINISLLRITPNQEMTVGLIVNMPGVGTRLLKQQFNWALSQI
jgi:hypothetical protein